MEPKYIEPAGRELQKQIEAEARNKQKERIMALKKSKRKTSKSRSAANGGKKANGEVRKGSKTEIVAKLLTRESGCTSADVLKATSWPAVSMPAMAKACGLKLRKEKVKGEPTRYYGS